MSEWFEQLPSVCVCGATALKLMLNGHNFSSVGPIMLILWFSESIGRGLSDDVLKSNVYFWPVFDKIPWAIAHGLFPKMRNYDLFQIWELSIPSERALSKLSENHKINVIGPTELKLWPFKGVSLNFNATTIN